MPLFRRRPLLRAAATAGGGYLMGKRRAGQEAQQAEPQRGVSSNDTARLEELGRLHEEGVLTDQEFAQQKATILGTS